MPHSEHVFSGGCRKKTGANSYRLQLLGISCDCQFGLLIRTPLFTRRYFELHQQERRSYYYHTVFFAIEKQTLNCTPHLAHLAAVVSVVGQTNHSILPSEKENIRHLHRFVLLLRKIQLAKGKVRQKIISLVTTNAINPLPNSNLPL